MCPASQPSNGHLVGEWYCFIDHIEMPDSGHVFRFREPQPSLIEVGMIAFIDGAIIGALLYALSKAIVQLIEGEQ